MRLSRAASVWCIGRQLSRMLHACQMGGSDFRVELLSYIYLYTSRFTATWVWARSARLRECLRAGVHVREGHVSC